METMDVLADHLQPDGDGQEEAVSIFVSPKILQLAKEGSECLKFGEHYEDFHEFETVNVCTLEPAEPQDEYNRQPWKKSEDSWYCDLQFYGLEHVYGSEDSLLPNDPTVFVKTSIEERPLRRSKGSQKDARSQECLGFHYKHTVFVHSPWPHLISTVTDMLSRTEVSCGRYKIEQEDSEKTVHVHFHRHYLQMSHDVEGSLNSYEVDGSSSPDGSYGEVNRESTSSASEPTVYDFQSLSWTQKSIIRTSSQLSGVKSSCELSNAPDWTTQQADQSYKIRPSPEIISYPPDHWSSETPNPPYTGELPPSTLSNAPDLPSQKPKVFYGKQSRQPVSTLRNRPPPQQPDQLYRMPSFRSLLPQSTYWDPQQPDPVSGIQAACTIAPCSSWASEQPGSRSSKESTRVVLQPEDQHAQNPSAENELFNSDPSVFNMPITTRTATRGSLRRRAAYRAQPRSRHASPQGNLRRG